MPNYVEVESDDDFDENAIPVKKIEPETNVNTAKNIKNAKDANDASGESNSNFIESDSGSENIIPKPIKTESKVEVKNKKYSSPSKNAAAAKSYKKANSKQNLGIVQTGACMKSSRMRVGLSRKGQISVPLHVKKDT